MDIHIFLFAVLKNDNIYINTNTILITPEQDFFKNYKHLSKAVTTINTPVGARGR
jgi:hypothetical protein